MVISEEDEEQLQKDYEKQYYTDIERCCAWRFITGIPASYHGRDR